MDETHWREEGAEAAAQYFRDVLEIVRLPSGAGTRVFRSLLERLGLFAPIYPCGERTPYLLGRREAARELLMDLAGADPEVMLLVLREGAGRAAGRGNGV